ncbi:hypothetical protein [Nocardia tengchongensis]
MSRFAAADTVVLRADGTLNVAAVDLKRANAIAEWARAANP